MKTKGKKPAGSAETKADRKRDLKEIGADGPKAAKTKLKPRKC